METVNRLDQVHDPMTEGERALDYKTRELIQRVGLAEEYDLVVREQDFPYTEENTLPEHMPKWVEVNDEGVHEKGRIPLAGIDAEGEAIDVFYDSISRFEEEKIEKARKFGRSIDNINRRYGTDWSATLYILPERQIYNEPDLNGNSGVFYTADTLENLTESEEFSKLSSGLFAGWLNLSPKQLLDQENL